MDFPPVDPASARARLAQWQERTDKMAADTQALAARVADLRATGRDEQEIAEATVDHTGALVDLVLSQRMKRSTEEQVAKAVLEALRKAKVALAWQSQEAVKETVGEDSTAGRAFMSGLVKQFGAGAEQQQEGR